jgi:hypothetical protein
VPQTEAQFTAALTLYTQRPDKAWGRVIQFSYRGCMTGSQTQ